MTPDFTKAKLGIGQLSNCMACGDFEVLDIFCSIRLNEIAYLVRILPDEGVFVYREKELIET